MSSVSATLPPASSTQSAVPIRQAAPAGAVAAGLALGISELIAAFLPGATSLIASVGQVVIDLQPPGAKDFVVSIFGTNDKAALEIVVVAAALAIGAVLGALTTRWPLAGPIGFAAFGFVGFAAALGDPLASPAILAVGVVVAVLAGIQSLSMLLAAAGRIDPSAVPDPARRSFLLRTTAVGIAAVVTGLLGRMLIDRAQSAPSGAAAELPPPTDVVPPLAAGADLSPTTPGLTPIIIPNDQFYRIDTALLVPDVDLSTWSLRIFGLVDRETTLTFEELVGLPLFEQYVTIACVSNEVGGNLVGNTKWTGVRLREVLDMAGVQTAGTQLVGRSVDGWTAGMPTSWVMDPSREPMIAVEMNDQPLPRAHGFPARLIVPGLFGYVSATKWLTELELTTVEGFNGYWVPLGWAKDGPILTQSRIDTPHGSVAAGRVPIAGVAWAPDRGVSRVEIGIDGQFHDADLSTPISDATWVQWVAQWDATAGDHTLTVRATDGNGVVQEELPSPPAPDGARGWHTVRVGVH